MSIREIIRRNVCTYFNLIFLVVALCLIFVGSYRDLTFLPLIVSNTLIGIIQQWRSQKELEKVQLINAPHTWVQREGKEMQILSEDITEGDVMILSAGSQVPADGHILEGEAAVNEALLTGEADEIQKGTGDELLSGSFVVSGRCLVRAEHCGEDSYISRLTQQAKMQKQGEGSEMIRSLSRLVKAVGILIIPLAALLGYQHYVLNGNTLRETVSAVAAVIIGMIPEGLFLLASVAMAVSTMRLALSKVLVHDMKSIETLARVDVLCVDKTGTITENTMRVSAFRGLNGVTDEDLKAQLAQFTAVMLEDNRTMKALKACFPNQKAQEPEARVNFSSAYKFSGATIQGTHYVMGAPEYVLGMSLEEYRQVIEDSEAGGSRVLVFGTYAGALQPQILEQSISPLGLVLFENPVRPQAEETFKYFKRQGVAVKVISGDSALAASRAAIRAGIPGADRCVDTASLTEEQLKAAAESYTVFGRVTPENKRLLVQALKEAGHKVAMTGDGVNDVLALKEADCSIAMAEGVQAAAQTAQMVLLESDFSRMPSVVEEGRRVVNNIERTASLFLVKNIFSFLLTLGALFFAVDYPLAPTHLSLVSMFTIGIPAFFLALEKNQKRITGKFMRNVLYRAAPAGITDFLMVGTLMVVGRICGMEDAQLSSCAAILLAGIGLLVLFKVMRPMNWFHGILWAAMAAGLLGCTVLIPFMQHIYGIAVLKRDSVWILLIFILAAEAMWRYVNLLFYKLTDWISRWKKWYSQGARGTKA